MNNSNSVHKQTPSKALLSFRPQELRHAANWIDRDNNIHQIINAVTMFRKLEELCGEIEIDNFSGGVLKFELNGKKINRYFESAS